MSSEPVTEDSTKDKLLCHLCRHKMELFLLPWRSQDLAYNKANDSNAPSSVIPQKQEKALQIFNVGLKTTFNPVTKVFHPLVKANSVFVIRTMGR